MDEGSRSSLRWSCYALFALSFLPTLSWMVQGWFLPGSYFAHGPLMVLVALYFGLQRRPELRQLPMRTRPRAVWLVTLGLLGHLASQALLVDSFSGWLLLPTLFAMLLAIEGPARTRVLAGPVGALFFAVPLPLFVTGQLAFSLKELASAGAVGLGQVLGLGLEREGARILVPGQETALFVGAECSGLRSLTALLALGYVFAVLMRRRRLWSRLAFLGIAALIALGANLLRLTVLAGIAKAKGVAFASGHAHDVSGYVLYAGAIVVLVVVDRLLPGRIPPEEPRALPEPEPANCSGRISRSMPALLIALGIPALVLGFWQPAERALGLAKDVPRSFPGYVHVREHALSERDYELLGTRDVVWRRLREESSDALIDLTVVFAGRNWKSLHPPELCLEAAGLGIEDRQSRYLDIDGTRTELSLLRADRSRDVYLIGYLFGGPGYETPSFTGYFWRNVPRALLRRGGASYMVRIELPLGDQSPEPRNEAQLARFLRQVLPRLRTLVQDA